MIDSYIEENNILVLLLSTLETSLSYPKNRDVLASFVLAYLDENPVAPTLCLMNDFRSGGFCKAGLLDALVLDVLVSKRYPDVRNILGEISRLTLENIRIYPSSYRKFTRLLLSSCTGSELTIRSTYIFGPYERSFKPSIAERMKPPNSPMMMSLTFYNVVLPREAFRCLMRYIIPCLLPSLRSIVFEKCRFQSVPTMSMYDTTGSLQLLLKSNRCQLETVYLDIGEDVFVDMRIFGTFCLPQCRNLKHLTVRCGPSLEDPNQGRLKNRYLVELKTVTAAIESDNTTIEQLHWLPSPYTNPALNHPDVWRQCQNLRLWLDLLTLFNRHGRNMTRTVDVQVDHIIKVLSLAATVPDEGWVDSCKLHSVVIYDVLMQTCWLWAK